jgi:hypothetical protein
MKSKGCSHGESLFLEVTRLLQGSALGASLVPARCTDAACLSEKTLKKHPPFFWPRQFVWARDCLLDCACQRQRPCALAIGAVTQAPDGRSAHKKWAGAVMVKISSEKLPENN